MIWPMLALWPWLLSIMKEEVTHLIVEIQNSMMGLNMNLSMSLIKTLMNISLITILNIILNIILNTIPNTTQSITLTIMKREEVTTMT